MRVLVRKRERRGGREREKGGRERGGIGGSERLEDGWLGWLDGWGGVIDWNEIGSARLEVFFSSLEFMRIIKRKIGKKIRSSNEIGLKLELFFFFFSLSIFIW